MDEKFALILNNEFQKDYFQSLKQFILDEYCLGKIIYPPGEKIFAAFELCKFDDLKVVIIGQDPYHGEDQAHGLSFSVRKGVDTPPSLKNIYKELKDDVNVDFPGHGNLSHWAKQGVLLLNSVLTVEQGKPGSHADKGWEIFTDSIIKNIADAKTNIVFILWGKYAQGKASLINSNHYILQSAHPSPFSANNGFFGCKHFSKTNEYLISNKKPIINW